MSPREPGTLEVIYCEFDGLFHPAEGSRYRSMSITRHKFHGHSLFESCPILEELLSPYPRLKIVLSTSWVQARGFRGAKVCLTSGLQSRVIGATFDTRHLHAEDFADVSRYAQIKKDVDFRNPRHWLAIDDDGCDWPSSELNALVLAPAELGLSCPETQTLLLHRLADIFSRDADDNEIQD
jgi:hypothetical protein